MPDKPSTQATYRSDLAIDLLTNKAGPIDTGGNRAMFALRFLIGLPILGIGILCLLFGLWPATIVLVLIAFPLMGARRKPRRQSIGVWEGNCPRCATPAFVHAPPLADHFRFGCPGCTRPIELKGQRYEAA